MNAQSFLALIREHYTLDNADAMLNHTAIKSLWESWFTAELLQHLTEKGAIYDIDIDPPYPAPPSDEPSDDASAAPAKLPYLTVKNHNANAKRVERRYASRADFAFSLDASTPSSRIFCEGFCARADGQLEDKTIEKMQQLLGRASKLKQENDALQIVSFCVLQGFIEASHMKPLKPLDNSQLQSYVLDSDINGSSSIARLSAVSHRENPRMLIIASAL